MKSGRSGAGIANALATIALVFSAVTGWAKQFQSHCFSDEAPAQMTAEHHQHQPEFPSPAWANADGHDCDHCPPSECSHAAPCAISAGGALVARVVSFVAPTEHGVELPSWSDVQPSFPAQPPTPPPQLLS